MNREGYWLTLFNDEKLPPGAQVHQAVKGKATFEPVLVVIADPTTNKVLFYRYCCPHCGMRFKSRKMCQFHAKGKEGSFQPTCKFLKSTLRRK
jgi:hypothetical protein